MTTENKLTRKYVGNGRAMKNGKGVNFDVNLTQLAQLVNADMLQTFKKKNGDLCAKLTIWTNEEPDQFGNSHAVCTDTFIPQSRTEAAAPANDLPF